MGNFQQCSFNSVHELGTPVRASQNSRLIWFHFCERNEIERRNAPVILSYFHNQLIILKYQPD